MNLNNNNFRCIQFTHSSRLTQSKSNSDWLLFYIVLAEFHAISKMGSDNQYLEINFTGTKQTLDGNFTWYFMIKQLANFEKKGLNESVWLDTPTNMHNRKEFLSTQLVKRSPRMQVQSPFTTHRSRETGYESSPANRNGRQQVWVLRVLGDDKHTQMPHDTVRVAR